MMGHHTNTHVHMVYEMGQPEISNSHDYEPLPFAGSASSKDRALLSFHFLHHLEEFCHITMGSNLGVVCVW